MGANVAHMRREPIPFLHRCGLLATGIHRRCLTGFRLY
jgi:hypothetical protein